jgi:hypothetical protein
MHTSRVRATAVSIGVTAAIAVTASLLWHVPYIYSVIGLVILGFVGYVVTLDEDLPGGWAPIPGGVRSVWLRLLVIAVLITCLVALAVMFPTIRMAGGT